MTAIPDPINSLVAAIDAAHEAGQEPPRAHLGASVLGHPCDRWLWLSFRWAVIERFPGRVLRLFRRGKLEEATLIADLRLAGIEITANPEEQSHLDFGHHIGGSPDGVVESGIPEAPKARHVLEIKTHSAKSFAKLAKEGVTKSHPMHYAQMVLYMHGTGIERALYVAVCKDDDRIHTERLRYHRPEAESLLKRGQYITGSDRMPEPISADPSWYQCKFCPAHQFCHETKLTREVNCRTCAHVTALPDGGWHCARWGDTVPTDFQRTGCPSHVLHPDLVPWPRQESESEWEAVYVINGEPVRNGEGDANVFASSELIAGGALATDETVKELRRVFDAEIVF